MSRKSRRNEPQDDRAEDMRPDVVVQAPAAPQSRGFHFIRRDYDARGELKG